MHFRLLRGGVNDKRVVLVRSGAKPLVIGDGLGHGPDATAWLAARIERASREGRRHVGAVASVQQD